MKKRYILGLSVIGLVGCDQKQPPQAPPAPAPTQQTAPAPAPTPVPALPAPKADDTAKPVDAPAPAIVGPEQPVKPSAPLPASNAPFAGKGIPQESAEVGMAGKTPTMLSRNDTQNSDAAVQVVKQATLNSVNSGTRIGKALDNRAMCKHVTWKAMTDSTGGGTKKLVQYKCDLTNYQSIFSQKLAASADKGKSLTPTEMAQTITFAVDGDAVTPQRCRIQYQLPTKKNKAFVENPYCLNLAYDSQYTSGWNDVIGTVISRAAKH